METECSAKCCVLKVTNGPDAHWYLEGAYTYVTPQEPRYCSRTADRLNADGTVTPWHEWTAEKLAIRQQVCEERRCAVPAEEVYHRSAQYRTYAAADDGYLMAAKALRHNMGAEDPADEKWEENCT